MLEAKIPADPQHIRVFADRLLGSNEVFSTFGLANSLAGFLVGPLVLAVAMMIRNLADDKAPGSRWGAIGLAAAPLLCLLTCLILTKSRSAWIGLLVGVAVLAWQERRKVPARLLLGAGLAGLVLVVALVAVGLATGRLDREVLTQSPLSMRYRWEYWQGAWGVITEGRRGGPRVHRRSGRALARAISAAAISSTSCRSRARRFRTRTISFSRSGP